LPAGDGVPRRQAAFRTDDVSGEKRGERRADRASVPVGADVAAAGVLGREAGGELWGVASAACVFDAVAAKGALAGSVWNSSRFGSWPPNGGKRRAPTPGREIGRAHV